MINHPQPQVFISTQSQHIPTSQYEWIFKGKNKKQEALSSLTEMCEQKSKQDPFSCGIMCK